MSHPPTGTVEEFLDTALILADLIDGGIIEDDPETALAAVADFNETFDIDPILGGSGSDIIGVESGSGFNFVFGGDGSDILTGKRGNDALAGSNGSDVLRGRGGDDFLGGGNGRDILFGGGGNDVISGGAGGDIIRGGSGDDMAFGGAGADVIRGGRGEDMLFGGAGADDLRGGKDDDILVGGRGDDILRGGQGADKFLFNPDDPQLGDDIIRDFELGVDAIVLEAEQVVASLDGNLGDDGVFGFDDLNAETGWGLSASGDGDLLVTHPGGTIEVDGVAFDPSATIEGLVGAGAVEVNGL